MNKAALRKTYHNYRQCLSEDNIDLLSLKIANTLLTIDLWDYQFYHVFLPIKKQHEVNTEHILNILQGKDKHIVISKSNFKTTQLKHYLLTDSTLIKNNVYHIPEPVDGIEIKDDQIEVVFVPLLAYDSKGYRVGYGKGFYDRFLANCQTETIKIGLSFFEPEIKIQDINTHDIPLDYVITPQEVYCF